MAETTSPSRPGALRALVVRWRRDVRLRLYGGVLCVVVLVTTLYTMYNVRALQLEAHERALNRAEEMTEVLGKAIARPLFDINNAAVESVVAALGASPDVAYIAVLGPDAKAIAESGRAPATGVASVIRMTVPVRYVDGGKTYDVGVVDLALKSTTRDDELRTGIRSVLLANGLVALAIFSLLALLERRMARPFADIQTSLHQLAGGDTNIRLSGLDRTDQIGQMSAAVQRFKQALEELHTTQARLKVINEGLERAVDERTRTLAQAVEQVRAGREQLQAVVDHSLDAVVLVDQAGRVTGWNARATELFGWTAAQATGQPLLDLLRPQSADGQALTWVHPGALAGTRGPLLQLQVTPRDGRSLPVEWVMARWDAPDAADPAATLGCVFVRDISERLQADAKERAALAKQAELFELRSSFIAMASHEFRTPLTTILSAVEMLRAYRDRLDASQQDALLASTEKGVARMTHLLERILRIGQANAERTALAPQRVSVAEAVQQVAHDLHAQYPNLMQRLHLLLPAPDAMAWLDPGLLRDVLGNLLNNAVKYSPDGGPIALEAQPSPQGWVFRVTDHGIGIPEKELPHVFESFHRASNVGEITGTGLGLAIVKRAVDVHRGEISVTSQPGHTCFTVLLPEVAESAVSTSSDGCDGRPQ